MASQDNEIRLMLAGRLYDRTDALIFKELSYGRHAGLDGFALRIGENRLAGFARGINHRKWV